MISLSGNKCFHSIVANLGGPLFSIFKELACWTLDLWEAGNFVSIFPLGNHDIFLYLKQPWAQPLVDYLHEVLENQEVSSWFLPLWEYFWPMLFIAQGLCGYFFWQLFSFFFHTYSPCILVLVFTGLCLAPLDGIKISGFVFSCKAVEQALLLLNSAAYVLATRIWVSILALSQLCEHGPLLLEAVCCVRNAFTSWIWVNIVDISSRAASRSHNCVCHFSVELPLSASVTFEYPSCLKAGKMWYFLASHQLIHEVICGNMSATSSSHFFLSLYSAFSSIQPIDPWSNLWKYVSNLLQSFLSVIVLSNGSDGTHFMTNVFKHTFVSVTNL